jgi:hypothetical protein
VYLTWRIVGVVLPGRPALSLGAAGVHAFTPMYVFISGSVNNDNLVVLLSSLALLMLIHLAQDSGPATRSTTGPGSGQANDTAARAEGADSGAFDDVPVRRYLALGIVLGLAALSKTSSLALTIVTAFVVVLRSLRRRSWLEFVGGGLATLVPVLAIAGWWYLRNLRLYGDPSGLNVFIEILGQRDVPADLAQLWRERSSFAAGYWGNFGGLNVPMPDVAYIVLNYVASLALVELAGTWLRWGNLRLRESLGRAADVTMPLGLQGWPFTLCVLWGLGVIVPWTRWASTTWSSQGRLIFAAMPVWSMLLALGVTAWLPRRLRPWVSTALIAFLVVLAILALVVWIPPVYALPDPLSDDAVAAIANPLVVDFREPDGNAQPGRDVMRLLGYEVEGHRTVAGDTVAVSLFWEALGPAHSESTVFVHLLGQAELLVAQRDTFPGLGLLSATRLEPAYRWRDRYVLQIPETAFAPNTAEIELGMYDTATGARFRASTPGGDTGDHVRFSRIEIAPKAGDTPNPLTVRFGAGMTLAGYDLDRRVARPGEEVGLTLQWEARKPMQADYTVSAQLVDVRQQKAAQVDSWPQGGMAPTSTWQPGQTIVDVIPLVVSLDAEPGAYDVRIAVYSIVADQMRHVPVVPTDGRMLADHIVLTQVRVSPQ